LAAQKISYLPVENVGRLENQKEKPVKISMLLSATALLALPLTSTLTQRSHQEISFFTASAQTNDAQASQDATEDGFFRRRENPCTPPDRITGSIEETAWRLWVASTCPVNQTVYPYVVWENWIEQAQMYPLNPANVLQIPASLAPQSSAPRLLHASPLALVKNPGIGATVPGLLGAADQNCNAAQAPPDNQKNLIICEEVRLNGATQDYITGTTLWNRNGQKAIAADHGNIQFPTPSLEIKADWISLSSIGLTCSTIPQSLRQSVHIEMINGNCFALVGMHLISKLINQWIWATFEPQNLTTNPFRCNVLGCSDSFGSRPARSRGAFTGLSSQLERLMNDARLAPEWKNYRLDGVQISFVKPNGKPTLMGNSIIEGENVGMNLKDASCISCHAISSVKNDGTDGITLLTGNPVGEPEPLPSRDWIRRDFVWSLFGACPPGASFQTCTQ
jgi:hypothetical protein